MRENCKRLTSHNNNDDNILITSWGKTVKGKRYNRGSGVHITRL